MGEKSSGSTLVPVLIGAVVGSVVFTLLIVGLVICLRRSCCKTSPQQTQVITYDNQAAQAPVYITPIPGTPPATDGKLEGPPAYEEIIPGGYYELPTPTHPAPPPAYEVIGGDIKREVLIKRLIDNQIVTQSNQT